MTVLEDDEELFPPYQGAPLLLKKTLDKYPELEDVLNKLSGKVTDDEMRDMNFRVNSGGENPEDVAREFLKNAGLLK